MHRTWSKVLKLKWERTGLATSIDLNLKQASLVDCCWNTFEKIDDQNDVGVQFQCKHCSLSAYWPCFHKHKFCIFFDVQSLMSR